MKPTEKDAGLEMAREWYERLHRAASRIVAAGVTHAPIITVLDQRNETHVIGHVGDLPKDFAAFLHRRLAKTPGIRCCAFVSEAYELKTKDPKLAARAEAAAKAGRPIDEVAPCDDAVMFVLRAGDRTFLATCRIDHAKRELARAPIEDTSVVDGVITGRFAG